MRSTFAASAADHERGGVHVEAPTRDRIGVGDEFAHERPDVERREHRLDDPGAETVQVQQVGDDAIEAPGVGRDAAGQVLRFGGRQVQVVSFQGPGQAEDRRQRRPQVVGHRLQERVLHVVDFAEAFAHHALDGEVALEVLGPVLLR